MIAWKKFANGATPESTGTKGDHFVGDYYVRFDKEYKAEIKALMEKEGMGEEEAKEKSSESRWKRRKCCVNGKPVMKRPCGLWRNYGTIGC